MILFLLPCVTVIVLRSANIVIELQKIKLKINSDGTITDTNELLNVEAKYKKLFKEIKLEKSSNKDDIDVLNNTSINKQIKFTLSMFSN